MSARKPVLHVIVRRDSEDPSLVTARAYKSWWGGPGVGGVQRVIGQTVIDATGMQEGEALAAAATDLALMLRGMEIG